MSKSTLFGMAAVGLATLAAPADAQVYNRGLRNACSDLHSSEGIRDCQSAFIAAAENVYVVQRRVLEAPRFERFGLVQDPEMVERSGLAPIAGRQVEGMARRYCVNIANKIQTDAGSERMDDGSRISLHRIVERAIACAEKTAQATTAAKVPVVTSLVQNLRLNAQDVRAQTNTIAMAY